MPAHFDICHTVTHDEIDAQNHVHNLRYIQWSLWAAGKHTTSMGLNTATELERGFGFVVRTHEAEYRRAALLDDSLIIRTWIHQIDKYSSWRQSNVCRLSDKALLARVKTRWVYADLRNHRIAEIPAILLERVIVPTDSPPLPWQ